MRRYSIPQNKRPSRYETDLDPEWGQTYMFSDYIPSWNVSPRRNVLVLHHDNEAGHVAELWGFLPSWAASRARRPINARIETAATSSYFRAWRGGRCVVPVDGIQPAKFMISCSAKTRPRSFWSTSTKSTVTRTQQRSPSCQPRQRGALCDIHEREPVALSAELARQRITRDMSLPEISEVLHQSLPFNSFHWHTISSRVNNPKNDGADLLVPSA